MGESFLRKIVRIYYDECIVILYKVSENIDLKKAPPGSPR